jgi:hypothetical protein
VEVVASAAAAALEMVVQRALRLRASAGMALLGSRWDAPTTALLRLSGAVVLAVVAVLVLGVPPG